MLNIWLNEWRLDAGIKKHLSWHMSRHTFATLSYTSGADLYTISKLLGHTSINTTAIYAKAVDEQRKKAVDAIPKI